MKNVAKCFNWGIKIGFIWLLLMGVKGLFWVYEHIDRGFVLASHLPMLFLDLGELLALTVAKCLLIISFGLYMQHIVAEYEQQQKQVKY